MWVRLVPHYVYVLVHKPEYIPHIRVQLQLRQRERLPFQLAAGLVEVIRNSLLLAGVDPLWQGTFVGAFIILAVVLQRLRGRRDG